MGSYLIVSRAVISGQQYILFLLSFSLEVGVEYAHFMRGKSVHSFIRIANDTLVVAGVCRVTVARSGCREMLRLISATKTIEPTLFLAGRSTTSGASLDIVRGRVFGEHVVSVNLLGGSLVATPEASTLSAVGVTVGGRRTEALLASVVTAEKELEEDGDEEEEAISALAYVLLSRRKREYSHSND